jgi:hypothetical protein
MDNGTEFFTDFKAILNDKNIGISKTIPYMPQSNSIVERIINKLIYNHMNEDYSKWSQFIDEAVNIYNNTKMFLQEKYLIMQYCFNRRKI